MKKTALAFLILCFSIHVFPQIKKDYPIKSIELKNVNVTGGFWGQRIFTNRDVTVPYVLDMCKKTGRVDNLLFAAKMKQGEYCTAYQFDDSDVYKSIEAACYSLISFPDKTLDQKLDTLISIIEKAQEDDGYLYSPREAPSARIKRAIGNKRWVNLQWSHELYVLGHLYEAAAAHYIATGKKTLLNVALKSAGLLLKDFGPDALQLPPGHQEVEIGLVKLYRITNDKRYLNLAKYFLDIRGRGKELTGRESWGKYAQDHMPPVDQTEAVGHAVRAAYMYSAMTDIAALTGDKAYANAVNKLWDNVAGKKLYVTGGIGSTGSGEALGANYDLPNMSAYNETCSSIANMMWNFRMFELYGDGKFLDVFERTLYNAFLSGIGMDGKSFFYPNPLQSYGTHGRSPWFTCACCPPNVARFIASLPEKFYSVEGNKIFVNIYSDNIADLKTDNSNVELKQFTNYPWNGNVKLEINPGETSSKFSLMLRIPGWAENKPIDSDLYTFMGNGSKPQLKVNGQKVDLKINKGFVELNRDWKNGDVVELTLPMNVRRVIANKNVDADLGRVAFERGPVMFCGEWPDNKDGFVRNILVPDDSKFTSDFKSGLLNGVETISCDAFGYKLDNQNNLQKYEQEFTAIPYYAWAHRGTGEMSVWIAREESAVSPLHGPTLASTSKVTVSFGRNPQAINDQLEPKSSGDGSVPFYHWWPDKGSTEWVQFDFGEPKEISQVEVYWFDDTGVGECRVPESWRVYSKDGDKWTPVYTVDKYGVEKDKYNSVIFETVRTSALKIEIKSQKDFAGGIQEVKMK